MWFLNSVLFLVDVKESKKKSLIALNAVYKRAATAAKLLQSCPTLCSPTHGSPPGSAVPGILQARTLEWVAISFSNAWNWKWSCSVVSDSLRPHGLQPIRLLCPWDFSRQEHWSGLPLPPPQELLPMKRLF